MLAEYEKKLDSITKVVPAKPIEVATSVQGSKEEFIKSIEILKGLENLCNFININTNDEFNDKEYIILKSHPKLIEKYNSK